MSIFTGKSVDLADCLFGCGGYYDKDRNPVKFGQEGVNCYYSDILKDFEAFKEKTKGVIYQQQHIKNVDERNHDLVSKYNKNFKILKHTDKIVDKRAKQGFRTKTYYTYSYYGLEYSQKELKKKGGVWIDVEIHFNTILDLIKYMPYHVYQECGSPNGLYVVIGSNSYVESEYQEHLQYGFESMRYIYDRNLRDLYVDIVRRLDYKLKERTHTEEIVIIGESEDPEYMVAEVSHEVDYNHPIQFVWDDKKKHAHWTSPKYYKENCILIHKTDVSNFLKEDVENKTVKINYVALPEGGYPIEIE